ncbi:hypothetical protein LUZ60_005652 [Juncus effusus]|nr:hypothetical protein LUZ60_005652 [Juncus effusus]
MSLSPKMARLLIFSSLNHSKKYHFQIYPSIQQFMATQIRFMTRHRRIQDRSKKKRIHDLEIATERFKVISKVLSIIETLKNEPEQVIPLNQLEKYRQQINLPKPYKVADFIKKSPKLFEIYKDSRGNLWCGLTDRAEELVQEETILLKKRSEQNAEFVTRLLMMSIDKKLRVDKIAHFRRDFGLPIDFRTNWIHKFPDHFRVLKIDDTVYLQLANWNPNWAITELEKKNNNSKGNLVILPPGELSLPFPMKFPDRYKRVFQYRDQIENFQNMTYLSPYADASGLTAGSKQFDKRAVAIIHEILSFTLEKRLVTDHLTHFRREFVMPQKLMRLFLKHIGIFYVSERGKRYSVFLNKAYNGSDLVEKDPLVVWREKVLRFTDYRGRIKKIINFNNDDNLDDNNLDEGMINGVLYGEESEMDLGDLSEAYKD